MSAILTLLVYTLILVIGVSTVVGAVVFVKDIHDFKSDKQMSLPRKRLIESILSEQDLEKSAVQGVISNIENSGGDDNAV